MFILTLGESDPFFNLSAEEYFLCEKDEDFFLLWQNEPCIVIGRNQNAADEINGDYVRTRSLPVVRRMTGGGAVYHDTGNLNFSFIINGEADRVELCRPVIDVLRSIGVVAEISGRNDILVGGRKISGTAMCSRGGRSDENKLMGHGVKSVRSRVANLSEYTKEEVRPDIIGAMLAGYMTERGGEIYELGESDIEAIEKLRDSKYSTDAWNCGAERLQKPERSRLSCGTVYIKKKTACGRIEDIRIFGDFMNIGDISKLEARLRGAEFRREEIISALEEARVEKYIPNLTADELADIITKSE